MMHTIPRVILFRFRNAGFLVFILFCGAFLRFPVLAQSPDLTTCCECLQDPDVAESMIRDACQTVHGDNTSQVQACADTLQQQFFDACLSQSGEIPTRQGTAEYAITAIVDRAEGARDGIVVELDNGTETTTAATNAQGVAKFSALASGDYTVRLPDWESVEAQTVTLTDAEPFAEVPFDLGSAIDITLNFFAWQQPKTPPYVLFIQPEQLETQYTFYRFLFEPTKEEVISVLEDIRELFKNTEDLLRTNRQNGDFPPTGSLFSMGRPGYKLASDYDDAIRNVQSVMGSRFGLNYDIRRLKNNENADVQLDDLSQLKNALTDLIPTLNTLQEDQITLKDEIGELQGFESTITSFHEKINDLQDLLDRYESNNSN